VRSGHFQVAVAQANRAPPLSSKMTGFDATASITVCAVTTDETEAPLFRLPIVPSEWNGLHSFQGQARATDRTPRRPRPPPIEPGDPGVSGAGVVSAFRGSAMREKSPCMAPTRLSATVLH